MEEPHMYGTTFPAYPQRIVCLTAETVEIVYALGAGDRVVGVSGATTLPEAREKVKIGGFTTFKLEKILSLKPDLVLAFSDLQKEIVRDLVEAGVTVLALNQRSLEEVYRAILLVGGVLGREEAARGLVRDFQDEVRQVREYSSVWPDRPRVFFEEWDDPLISGITWVSELIEIAGGRDIAQRDELTGHHGQHAVDGFARGAGRQHDQQHAKQTATARHGGTTDTRRRPHQKACPKLMNQAVSPSPGRRLTLKPRSTRMGPTGDL